MIKANNRYYRLVLRGYRYYIQDKPFKWWPFWSYVDDFNDFELAIYLLEAIIDRPLTRQEFIDI